MIISPLIRTHLRGRGNKKKKIMNEKEWNDDMSELEALSQNLGDIEFTKQIPRGLISDARTTTIPGINGNPMKLYDWMVKEFGHCILGKWQFLYKKGNKSISCIRSGASFGNYEIYGDGTEDAERFEIAEKCLKRIKELL